MLDLFVLVFAVLAACSGAAYFVGYRSGLGVGEERYGAPPRATLASLLQRQREATCALAALERNEGARALLLSGTGALEMLLTVRIEGLDVATKNAWKTIHATRGAVEGLEAMVELEAVASATVSGSPETGPANNRKDD